MIYTLTLNPAVDYRMSICNIEYGATNRATSEQLSFGGKGINVSKVLKNLGIESVALGFCAGFTGDALLAHLDEYGIKHDFIKVGRGNTRINVKLSDAENRETEINASGPEVTATEKQQLFEKLKNYVTDGDIVILSGSVPKGVGNEIYSDIMRMLSARRISFVVDATGELLKNTLEYKPFLIKPNISELCGLLGRKLSSKEEVVAAAKELKSKGAQNVLVSMGGDGALLVDERGEVLSVPAHKGKVINTVGSGDSMVAGFVAGSEKSGEYALALGNACGGATAFSEGLATKAAAESLLKNQLNII